MNKDRVEGAVENVGGKIKEAAGKSTGDQKMVAAGQAEQKIGKVQNAVGGLKVSGTATAPTKLRGVR
jgi:uncharacterized protein YjbJ (UPF0337 family)